ncbi:MAG TPA: serine/threonine-protein kinase, partial [Polyangiaceae bacterium]|nr:serine/threonine-protein kinase [Polyangiaceae bacterium]
MHYASGVATEKAPGPASTGTKPESEGDLPRLEHDDVQLIEAEPGRLDLSVWNDAEAVRGAANRQLAGNVLEAAVKRLGNMGLLGALAFATYLLWLALLGSTQLGPVAGVGLKVALAGIVLSLLLLGVTRLPKVPPHNVADLGNLYLFAISLSLGILRHSQASAPSELLRQVSPVVIPILAFGALIPTVPGKALVVMLVAAAMDPLGLVLMRSYTHYSARELIVVLSSPLLAALVAQQISKVVHRLTEGIAKAREVGSYKLVERLGMGGMAEVWRANHRMLRRPAAVKLIRPKVLIDHGPADSERLLRLFTREVRTTASLRSPHTIQVYDFGITREGAFYYVMELLDGIDLMTLVERFGPQPAERVASLMRQVCHSLREAHARNFVHRDIKPANVLTCAVGGDYDFVKVLDFGLVLDRHLTSQELEDEKQFVGTPAVMAPEMLRFQAPVDARADLYALGCVGYWLITGKRVFEAETRHDMLVMHAHQKPVLPSRRIDRPMHPGLEAIVMQCLEKNPNKRPQTARELADALGALQFEHPWTDERAELWWKQHQPEQERATSALDEKERASLREQQAAAPAALEADAAVSDEAEAR